ncbi:hypothetical protein VNO78_22523 [Psophocarpus tetragonolobus]|uniref:Uncharacterized protein n=1 Tax=Psophocarpus tetragonolobus TaxID=3891 RepID=A0AAN9XBM8_PSOTE
MYKWSKGGGNGDYGSGGTGGDGGGIALTTAVVIGDGNSGGTECIDEGVGMVAMTMVVELLYRRHHHHCRQ